MGRGAHPLPLQGGPGGLLLPIPLLIITITITTIIDGDELDWFRLSM